MSKFYLYVDLSEYVGIDTFDAVVKAIEDVVNDSQSLRLDSPEDRLFLIAKLWAALGVSDE